MSDGKSNVCKPAAYTYLIIFGKKKKKRFFSFRYLNIVKSP